ncbi:tail sheath protein [uncultured Caudovirales phage]|uniref:Tail sheath protein n=1 Tax=uncultured Caudovirales phage TaxID=2100421 RepID=A0A6J5KWJ3_9CAUD|nr:tail sheath protein [uncultured Caudovirales phage]
MPFQLSPGVAVIEKDYSSIIPAVSTSAGAFAGMFSWGPVLYPVTVSSENDLVNLFGKPNDTNFTSFFTASNFLSYTNNLKVVRANANLARNAVTTTTKGVSTITVTGATGYSLATSTVAITAPPAGGVQATAVVSSVDVNGNPTITVTNPGSGYISAPTTTITDSDAGAEVVGTVSVVLSATQGIKINNITDYETTYLGGSDTLNGEWAAKYPGVLGNSITVSMADSASYATWTYKGQFNAAPGTSSYAASVGGANDEMHIILIDALGLWTGTVGTVLEKFAFVSKAYDARLSNGTNNYYKTVINNTSNYIWWLTHTSIGTNWGSTARNTTFVLTTAGTPITVTLSGGVDDLVATDGNLMTAFGLFANSEQYDISLIPVGAVSATVASYVINNVAAVRLDCMVFASAQNVSTGAYITSTGSTATDQIIAYRNALPGGTIGSYAALDSGYKYQYDRFNDVYRWVPLNGDVAGICARTDLAADTWYSPGGMNRGQVKHAIKLSFNPNKTDRDTLYQSGVNPVVSFPGMGTVLFGDKTLQDRPSAFDRINVRRLFIVLEKAIATAGKYQLFEFNDGFTRAQFKNLVEPFLRDVQGRRGVTDFRVVCNESNNTAQVISSNNFVADIYIKPNYSINYITLNFIAARSGIAFEEIGG